MNQKCFTEIEKIRSFVEKATMGAKEGDNLSTDLEAIRERLESGNYKDTHFLNRNIFDVPKRTEEFLGYMESYSRVGRCIQTLFQSINLPKAGSVLDLCAGWAPKVPLGLYYYGFEGDLTVLDSEEKSIKTVKDFMKLFHIQYSIQPRVGDFWDMKNNKDYDVIMANHIIDDLAVDYFCKKKKIEIEIYKNEASLKFVWEEILKEKDFQRTFSALLAEKLGSLCGEKSFLIITQYKSLIEHLLNLEAVTKWNRDVFLNIKGDLQKRGFVLKPSLDIPTHSYFQNEDVLIFAKH